MMCAFKQTRQISVLLIVLLIVSGLYFADRKIVSAILSETEINEMSGLCIKENNVMNQELCSEEVLGMRGFDTVRVYGKHTPEQTDTRAEMIFLSTEPFLIFSVFLSVIEMDGLNQKICRSRFIIDYIHHQDGAKSLTLLSFHNIICIEQLV